jgi:leader peptidase (prepilin peptidase)/N-methyltransferase
MSEVWEMIADMPPWFWLGWFFLIGSFVGSFLNVVVYRLPRNCLSINNPKRSFCPSCKTQLKGKDNIPILGWALLRGKCRYCGVKYGARYPLVELLVAVLFTLAAWRVLYADGNVAGEWQAWLTVLHIILIVGLLVPWALIDYDLQVIPDKLTLGPLIVFIPFAAHSAALDFGMRQTAASPAITHLIYNFQPVWLDSMLSAVTAGVAAAAGLWLIGKFANVIFRKRVAQMGGESMGMGDVKLMVLLGVMLGWPKLVAAFFVAIFFGAAIGSVQLLLKKGPGTPFGPYLAIGALAAALGMDMFVGLYEWYMSFLQGLA